MNKLIRCFVLCALAQGSHCFGATITPASNSATDVQTAINSAANGDTISVPSGSVSWGGITIPGTKYVTLNGNGSTIALSGTLSITPHATGNTRVTGFTFNISGGGVWVYDQPTTACWRIDHCTFTGSGTIINLYARGAGLMDHCNFPSIANAQETMHLWGWGASDTTGWTTPVLQDHLFYIEDCTFTGAAGNSSCCFQGYYGSRVCARYNTVSGAMYEQHGTGGMMGARWWEFYGNHLSSMVICLRAGSGVVHDNTCSGVNLAMQEEDSGYPADYQIGRGINNTLDPAYYWNNTGVTVFLNANNVCAVGQPNMVLLNRDVYASAKPGYTPYTYPHPLIAGGTGGGAINQPPVANAAATPTSGAAPLAVSFSSAGSSDPEGTALTYSWVFGDGATSTAANPSHTYQNPGTYSAQLTVSDGTNTTASSALSISATGTLVVGVPFAATAGVITAPFTASGGIVSQAVETGVTNGGSAVYNFVVPTAGDYVISALANAPSGAANSFFINIDAQPTDPTMIWDIIPTTGFTTSMVSWRGNGSDGSDQFSPISFTLSAGTHQLIIVGREAGVQLQTFTIVARPAPPQGFRVVGP